MINILKSKLKVSMLGLLVAIGMGVYAQNSMPISKLDKSTSRRGEIVWVDLVTNNAKQSQNFFKELLGWNFKDFGTYAVALSGNKPVAGIMEDKELTAGEKVSYWVLSASVDDVPAATKKVKSAGGKILEKPVEIPGRGVIALVEDSQGAYFALFHNNEGDPKASRPGHNEWLWAELWTNDVEKAVGFYKEVLGVDAGALNGTGADSYYRLKGATYEYGGITKLPVKGENPIWLPILSVKDAEATANQAKRLGGAVLMNPLQTSSGKLALIATPYGAPFLIQEYVKKM